SDARVEVATVKVGRGDVDADMLKGNAAIQPYAQIYRDGVHDRVGHHVGEARLAESFLEILGCEHSTIDVADAGKRFKADDLGRFELDERLVKRRHATLAQGLVNHGDGVEAAGDGGAHAKFEGNEAAAAGRLAVVECQVGVLGKLFSVGRRIAENAACGDVAVERVALEVDGLVDPLKDGRCPFGHAAFAFAAGNQNAKFVADEAIGGDFIAKGRKAGTNSADQGIAGGVAQTIVDALEVVQVEKDERKRHCAAGEFRQVIQVAVAVAQACQRIAVGQGKKLRARFLVLDCDCTQLGAAGNQF